jgi:hypothetical protein
MSIQFWQKWYQSCVDRKNTSLVRRVIFLRLFSNQNYFYLTLFKTCILQLIFALCLIFSSNPIIQMANDGSYKSNNDVESPPSTLEKLLIVQNQFFQIVQQILVQMQDINQLMQSMEARPSSWKRKSNTHHDSDKAQKINTTKKAAPNHKEGSTSAKATTTCFNYGQVDHFVNRCPDRRQCPTPTPHPTDHKLLRMQTKSEEMESATIVDRRVTSLIHAPTHVLVLLWHRHLLQHHHPTRKLRKRRKYI